MLFSRILNSTHACERWGKFWLVCGAVPDTRYNRAELHTTKCLGRPQPQNRTSALEAVNDKQDLRIFKTPCKVRQSPSQCPPPSAASLWSASQPARSPFPEIQPRCYDMSASSRPGLSLHRTECPYKRWLMAMLTGVSPRRRERPVRVASGFRTDLGRVRLLLQH